MLLFPQNGCEDHRCRTRLKETSINPLQFIQEALHPSLHTAHMRLGGILTFLPRILTVLSKTETFTEKKKNNKNKNNTKTTTKGYYLYVVGKESSDRRNRNSNNAHHLDGHYNPQLTEMWKLCLPTQSWTELWSTYFFYHAFRGSDELENWKS